MLRTAIILLLVAPTALGVPIEASEPVQVTALAVAQTSQGYLGLASTVEARVLADGAGQVFVDTKPLSQTDMQASARLAARVAAETLGLTWDEYDYLVVMRSEAPIIGGPSAGAVMTLAFATALHNLVAPDSPWTLDPAVAATGTINPDGTIGPVGGVPAKAEGAADDGIRLFLYPAGLEQAATEVAGVFGTQTVLVDMAEHCTDLGIVCRPIATIRDLIEASAGVRLIVPEVEVPTTQGYADILEPSVGTELARLRERVETLAPASTRAQDAHEQASDWLQQADDAMAQALYYQAATFAFRGQIQIGFAENLEGLEAADDARAYMQSVLTRCEEAASAAVDDVDDLAPRDLTGWLAAGAAQERAAQATNLGAQARQRYEGAFSITDWHSALHDASFCYERALSSGWWAGLGETFPASTVRIEDATGMVQDLLERAQEATIYSQAVGVPTAGIGEAQGYADRGWLPAATMAAVRAETDAAIALQQAVTGGVPAATLEAALQAASRAVAAARVAGAEPLVSVSLLELAATEDDASALSEYWQARSLALLTPASGGAPGQRFVGHEDHPLQVVPLAAAFGLGITAGAGLVGVIVLLALAFKPRRPQRYDRW